MASSAFPPSAGSTSSYPLNTFAQLTAYPPIYGTCFSEIIPIHLNPEYFPNEIPLILPPPPYHGTAATQTRRGRPPKPQDQKKISDAPPRIKEPAKEKKRSEYRQYWLSSVKLPIEDSVLHSRLGIRRLGPAVPSARAVSPPSFLVPVSTGTDRIDPDNALFVYFFLQTFAPYLSLPRYDINAFFQLLLSPHVTTVMTQTFISVYRFLEPELILASDGLIQQLDREEQQFLQTYGKNAYTSRSGLQHAVSKLKSDLLFFRHLFESAPVTERTIWSLIVQAVCFITGPAVVEFKEDLFFAEDTEAGAVELESSWVVDEALDYKDFGETHAGARCRILKNLIEKLLDTAIVKRVLDVNAEVRVRLQAELVQLNKNEQRLSARILNAKRGLEVEDAAEGLQKQLETDTLFRGRLVAVRAAIERLLLVQPHSSEPIGQDREGNEYFAYPYAPNTVLVWLKKQHTIGAYVGEKRLEKLIDSLDARGVREEALRRAVLSVKTEDEEAQSGAEIPEMPEAELAELLEKDHDSVAMEGDEEAPESFAFLRQTLAVAREATKKSLDIWMGDTENVVQTGDVGEISARLIAFVPGILFPGSPHGKAAVRPALWNKLYSDQMPEPEEFAAIVGALSNRLVYDATEKQVLNKIVAGRSAEVVGEEVECNFCAKRCVNSVLLDVHVKKWCKQKNANQMEEGEEGAAQSATAANSSWIEAVESVPMPFPSIGQAKQLTTNVATSGAGAFVCEACGKEFGQQSALSLHIRKWCKGAVAESAAKAKVADPELASIEGPPFKCPHCKREMSTFNGLTVHLGRWCPDKAYGGTVDLTTGWSDEDTEQPKPESNVAPPESDLDIGTPAESVEEILLGGEVAKVSKSTAALALTWLLSRAQSEPAESE